MIELPEAIILAQEINTELKGKRIDSAERGNTPHKFAFYNGTPEEYAQTLAGKTIGEAEAHGSMIKVAIDPGYMLFLGWGGERILYHTSEKTLPKKHQFLLRFEDSTYLTITVQMWGFIQLWPCADVAERLKNDQGRITPLSDAFTYEYFNSLFDQLEPEDSRAIKFFYISKPGVFGVGNGYLQDILFKARIHPRRRAGELGKRERRALYKATRDVMRQAVRQGGRDTEFDLHNAPGHYWKLMDARSAGTPCPECGTPIAKASFLGGAVYFCPKCQVAPG